MSILIPGDVLEGGGQILRIAVAMSAITNRSISIDKIRQTRRKPGLAAQHLTGVLLVKNLSNGKTTNTYLGSTSLSFWPSRVTGGDFVADTKTAGSVALLLQAALPCCLFGNRSSSLVLKGGTNADLAPPVDYTLAVFKPVLEKFGATFSCDVKRRGFFPKGNGEVIVEIPPIRSLKPINLTNFGEVNLIVIEAYCSGTISPKLAEKTAETAKNLFMQSFRVPIKNRVKAYSQTEAFGSGWGLNVITTTTTGCILGSSVIGTPSQSPEQLARLAEEQMTNDLKCRACVDQYLQDQLILFMALASGTSTLRTGPLTLHTETAIHVVSLICEAKFRVERLGDGCLIECDGIGFTNDGGLGEPETV